MTATNTAQIQRSVYLISLQKTVLEVWQMSLSSYWSQWRQDLRNFGVTTYIFTIPQGPQISVSQI
jgi:hypothetical protein